MPASCSLQFHKISPTETEALAEFLAGDTWPFFLGRQPTEAEVHQRIAEGDFFGEGDVNFWMTNSRHEKIGLIELYQLDDLAPMFSIRLKSAHRGKGMGKVALQWLTRHVFENYPDKRRIEAQTREDNVPMRKLFREAGFVKEAYYRAASPTEDGGRVASVGYGILREDWLSGKSTPVRWGTDEFFSGDLV